MKKLTELTSSIKMKLISGLPIEVDSIGEIKPLTLLEIAEKGYDKYQHLLNFFAFTKSDFIKEEFLDKVDIPLFSMMLAFSDDEFKDYIVQAIKYFMGVDVEIILEHLMIIPKDPTLHWAISNDNFDDLKQVIRWQNGLDEGKTQEEIRYKDDRARRIQERLLNAKSKVDAQKRKEGNADLDFVDIISAIASKSFSLNKLTILNLTVYQMYDEFRRLDIIDNYHVGLSAMMQGAKIDDLKHWTSKIQD
jgi:hypothetical protein